MPIPAAFKRKDEMSLRRMHLSHKIATCFPAKLRSIAPSTGIVSFTFDDFPRSAWEYGKEILGREGLAATWYVAGGLTGRRENGQSCHTVDDLLSVRKAGHEIASHGYSHVRSSALSAAEFDAEIERNDCFLGSVLGEPRPSNFAYPFGRVNLGTKRRAAARFASARGARAGLNRGLCDFAQLRANSIDTLTVASGKVEALICEAAQSKAWLLFFTHDISKSPSRWGTTPSAYAEVVKMALISGCRILPVRDAISAMER